MSIDHNPKVFISYSWASEEYKRRVLNLATRLRKDGVDVILDRWNLKPGHDMNAFMERSVRNAEKVLILCESSYKEKADNRYGGVGKETYLITPKVFEKYDQEKFIPVVMENPVAVPDYLSTRCAVFFIDENEEEYKVLLQTIYEITEVAPPLGPIPLEEWVKGDSSVKGKLTHDVLQDEETSQQRYKNNSRNPKLDKAPERFLNKKSTSDKEAVDDKSGVQGMKMNGGTLSPVSTNDDISTITGSALHKNARNYKFGRYQQGNNGEEKPLLWRVLYINSKENKALLVTENLITCQTFHDKLEEVAWEDCSLRRKLNEDFYIKAFNENERERIALFCNQNPDNVRWKTNACEPTPDRVFLLSIEEVERYFQDNRDREAKLTPYAKEQYLNIEFNLEYGFVTQGWWWLRSPGVDNTHTACVDPDGCLFDEGHRVVLADICVRPAIWLNL